jgi:hypothetical protein
MIRGLKHESKAALAMQHATRFWRLACTCAGSLVAGTYTVRHTAVHLSKPRHTDAAGLNRPEP